MYGNCIKAIITMQKVQYSSTLVKKSARLQLLLEDTHCRRKTTTVEYESQISSSSEFQ